ncbi:hypothetical protein D3C86_1676200 [compost metagenome]
MSLDIRLIQTFQLPHIHIDPLVGPVRGLLRHIFHHPRIPEGSGDQADSPEYIGVKIRGVERDHPSERTAANACMLRARQRKVAAVDAGFDAVDQLTEIFSAAAPEIPPAGHQRRGRPRRIIMVPVMRTDAD